MTTSEIFGEIPKGTVMSTENLKPSYDFQFEFGVLARLERIELDGKTTNLLSPRDEVSFCNFLLWAFEHRRRELHPSFALHLKSFGFFYTQDEVVEYFKKNSLTIFLPTWPTSKSPLASGEEIDLRPAIHIAVPTDDGKSSKQLRFFQLSRVVPDTEPSNVQQDAISMSLLPILVSEDLLFKLHNSAKEQNSEIRCLSLWPVERTFVYIDISDSSKFSPSDQLLVLNTLIALARNEQLWAKEPHGAIAKSEANLCIGDGYIFVFTEAHYALYFAAFLACLIEKQMSRGVKPEFHFRMSIHSGKVYRFWDWLGRSDNSGRWNYIGEGITGGQRVLSAIGKSQDDVVFISGEARQSLQKEGAAIVATLRNRGRKKDKHGELRRVYEADHTMLQGYHVQRAIPD